MFEALGLTGLGFRMYETGSGLRGASVGLAVRVCFRV